MSNSSSVASREVTDGPCQKHGEINLTVISHHPLALFQPGFLDCHASLARVSAAPQVHLFFYLVFDYEPITMIIPVNRCYTTG